MSWESIIALSISAIGLAISIWAIIEARKSNKAVLMQNREIALNDIETQIKDIDVQISKAHTPVNGHSHYGNVTSIPNFREIKALKEKKQTLEEQKRKLQQQL